MVVYIKGMEMPTSCANCDLAKHFDGYNENDCPFNCFSYYDCPIIPVPPHGRLIDADALNYTMLYKENWMRGTGVEAPAVWRKDIDAAPTIIPAEPPKEGE